MAINPEDFGVSFKGFLDQMQAQKSPVEAPFFARKLQEHFSVDPALLPVVSDSFAPHDHANIHLAIEHYLARDGRSAEVLGVAGGGPFGARGLSELVTAHQGYGAAPAQGPVQYANVTLADERVLACVRRGLFLVSDGEERLVIYAREEDRVAAREDLIVEVMAPDRAAAERCLHELRQAMRARNVYRGHVISIKQEGHHEPKIGFHRLPTIGRDGIILPEGLLSRTDRTHSPSDLGSRAIGFARRAGT